MAGVGPLRFIRRLSTGRMKDVYKRAPEQAHCERVGRCLFARFFTVTRRTRFMRLYYAEIGVRAYQETSGRNSRKKLVKRTARKCTGEMEGQPPTTNGGSNDCEILDELMALTDWKKT